jgi:probable phosphoglycerate mutase
MGRTIVLWRHGRTSWNANGQFQGQIDVPLDDEGRAQVRAAARSLALLHPARIIASDLERAADTAQALSDLTGVPIALDVRLRETWAGEWEGLSRDDIEARYPGQLAEWVAGFDMRPGGGETRVEVAERVKEAIDEALDGLDGDDVLVVATHGGSARAVIGILVDLPPDEWAVFGVLANANWSVLKENPTGYGPPWRVQEYNARSLPVEGHADDR